MAYLHLTLLLVALIYVYGVNYNKPNPLEARFRDRELHFNFNEARPHLELLFKGINLLCHELREVYLVRDLLKSAKYAFGFLVVGIVGKCFSTSCLAFFGVIIAFAWPKLYEEKHAEIDRFASLAKVKAEEYTKLAVAKLPPTVTQKFRKIE